MKNTKIFGVKQFLLVTAALVTVVLSSCKSTENYVNQWENRENATKLRVGMTKTEVIGIMGTPLEEKYNTTDVLYFYTHTVWHDFQPTVDETFPVAFKNDRVIGFGPEYYKNHILFQLEK